MRWICLLLLASCSTITMRISQPELQADLDKHFPRDIDKHLLVLHASEPRIDFPGAPDVVGLRLRVDAASASGRSHLAGTARVEGKLEYVESEHAFYLREPRVTELVRDSAEGDGSLARVASHVDGRLGTLLTDHAVRAAIEELLRLQPIYRLDARRSDREAKAIRHLRSAHVDGTALLLEVGL